MNSIHSHIVLLHGSASNSRKKLPLNIELVLFTQVGEELEFDTMQPLFSILQRTHSIITTDALTSCSAYRYLIPIDTSTITYKKSIFMKVYTPSYDIYYPDLTLILNEPYLGFYDISKSSYSASINTSTGHLDIQTSTFLYESSILYGQSFSLSTLLTWISDQTVSNTISRVYICCCQTIYSSEKPTIEDMELIPPESGWPDLEASILDATNKHPYNRWSPVL
jgi:hypothetical protein